MNAPCDVLIVDDEPVLLRAVSTILDGERLSIDGAESSAEGLCKLRDAAYRLVLCDLMLPETDGIAMLGLIRREIGDIPVVMITGYATLESALDSFKSGAFDFLPKPFDEDELLAVVRRALGFYELDASERESVSFRSFAGRQPAAARPASLHGLGRHAWTWLERDGSARIGVGESFRGLEGAVETVTLPVVGEEVLQGKACVRITARDGLVHRLWSPLSGRVLDTNPAWSGGRPERDRLFERWLVRILPSDPEEELGNLDLR